MTKIEFCERVHNVVVQYNNDIARGLDVDLLHKLYAMSCETNRVMRDGSRIMQHWNVAHDNRMFFDIIKHNDNRYELVWHDDSLCQYNVELKEIMSASDWAKAISDLLAKEDD